MLSNWTTPDWRRIDGGTDYWVDTPTTELPRRPLPDLPAERLSRVGRSGAVSSKRANELARVQGRTPLYEARLMLADGYSREHVSRVTGWGSWWLS